MCDGNQFKAAVGSSTDCVTINQLLYGPSQQNGMLSLLTFTPWININLKALLSKNKAVTWDGGALRGLWLF